MWQAAHERQPRARKLLTTWFYGAVAVSALLVAATAMHILGQASGPAAYLLGGLSLTGENNPAAWWSGMLLAVVSLHAFDGHALLRRRELEGLTGRRADGGAQAG